MAKRSGIGVEEFGFGLPPRIWGRKVGETIYSLNWLPFGGFVKLVGEDSTDEKRTQKNSFYTKPIRQRAMVVVAGVFMNLILAVVIFYIVIAALGFKVSLPLLVDHKFKFVNETRAPLVAEVNNNSPAKTAGLAPGDSIVAVNGQNIKSVEELQKAVRASEGEELVLTVENPVNNKQKTVKATPTFNETLKNYALGVGLSELAVLNYNTPTQKIFAGFIHSYNTVEYSIKVFADLIGFAVKERNLAPVSEGVSGPVGIAALTKQAVAFRPTTVFAPSGLSFFYFSIV